jgi:hypothetical protein
MIAKVEEYARHKGMEEDGTERLLKELRCGPLGRPGGSTRPAARRRSPRGPPRFPTAPPLSPSPRGLVVRLETDPNLPLDDKIKGLRQALYKM